MNTTDFSAFFKQLRKETDLTQRELADILGVTDKAVSRWETGKNYPDIEMLEPIGKALGVSVSELLACKRLPKEEIIVVSEQKMISEMNVNQKQRKRFVRLLISVLVVFAIISSLFYFSFYNISYRIVSTSETDPGVLQTDSDTFYCIDDVNSDFSREIKERIDNIYSTKNLEEATAYYYETYHYNINPFNLFVFPKKVMCDKLYDETVFYYLYHDYERLSFYAKKDLQLPEITASNIEKICIYDNTGNNRILQYNNPHEIEQFLKNYTTEQQKLNEKYDGCYFCYFYYKDTYIYEEVSDVEKYSEFIH